MMIGIQNLPEAERATLSRTTLWRAKKRGTVRAKRPPVQPFEYPQSQFKAEFRTAFYKVHNLQTWPAWLTFEDLKQEAFLSVWLNSGYPEIHKPGYRVVIMWRRLRDLAMKKDECGYSEEVRRQIGETDDDSE